MYDPRLFNRLKEAKANKLTIYAKNEAFVPNDVPAPPVEMGEQTVLQQLLLGGVKNNFSRVDMILEIISFLKTNDHGLEASVVKEHNGKPYLDLDAFEDYLNKLKPTPYLSNAPVNKTPSPLPLTPRPRL